MSTPASNNPPPTPEQLAQANAELAQILAGYCRNNPQGTAALLNVRSSEWSSQAHKLLLERRLNVMNSFSDELLNAIAQGDIEMHPKGRLTLLKPAA